VTPLCVFNQIHNMFLHAPSKSIPAILKTLATGVQADAYKVLVDYQQALHAHDLRAVEDPMADDVDDEAEDHKDASGAQAKLKELREIVRGYGNDPKKVLLPGK